MNIRLNAKTITLRIADINDFVNYKTFWNHVNIFLCLYESTDISNRLRLLNLKLQRTKYFPISESRWFFPKKIADIKISFKW